MTWKPTHRRKVDGLEVHVFCMESTYFYKHRSGLTQVRKESSFLELFEPLTPPPMPEPLVVNGIETAECYVTEDGRRRVRICDDSLTGKSAAALLAWLPGAVEWQKGQS